MTEKIEQVGAVDSVNIYRLESEPFGTNAYFLICSASKEGLLIDTPGNAALILEKLRGINVSWIIITHGHADHTLALEEIKRKLKSPLAVHRDDRGLIPLEPDRLLEDGETISCGGQNITILHTPGHTKGSISLRVGNYLLSGDTIFPNGPGRTASAEDFKTIFESIETKILKLSDSTVILPGHGGPTTVGRERKLIANFMHNNHELTSCGDVTWS
jgi:hydroxyacylglutathione hydrolase